MFKLYSSLILCGLVLTLTSCRKHRVVNTSFYFWKTVYDKNDLEEKYMDSLHVEKLYVRMMDVDAGDNAPVPISPITFKSPVSKNVRMVPVVFIVNQVLKNQTHSQLDDLAAKITYYVAGKVKQSGQIDFDELQIDCDWTRTTRDDYFYLLRRVQNSKYMVNKKLSATLRLHQLKNQIANGIPPVSRVMLMCYNMGNLRQYGTQNSILEQRELEKYVNRNLSVYPIPVDIGLPLFSWAVVFRNKQYLGIAKRLQRENFSDSKIFKPIAANFYSLERELPALGLKRGDEIRWETIPEDKLKQAATYIQKYISTDSINIIYFHLDEPTLKRYKYETLEETAALFR